MPRWNFQGWKRPIEAPVAILKAPDDAHSEKDISCGGRSDLPMSPKSR
jgi:hypothetical protein